MNASVVNTILERSQGCCEAMLLQSGCNGRGEHIHHRRLRSQAAATRPQTVSTSAISAMIIFTGTRGILTIAVCCVGHIGSLMPCRLSIAEFWFLLNPDGTYIKQCEGGFYAER